MAKGGYLSWNPLNWFKSAPEEAGVPAPLPMAQSSTPPPMGGPYGGKKRKTKTRRVKKARSKTGRRKH